MKKTLFLILFLQITMLGIAQTNGTPSTNSYSWHVGLNSTNLLKNILSFNSNPTDDPYTLVGTRTKDGKGLRMGIGLNLETNKKNSNLFSDRSNSKLDFRIGYQFEKPLWKKLSLLYAIDILGGYENDYSVNQGIQNIDNLWHAGGGPILGLSYRVNNRLQFTTESSLYFTYSEKVSELTLHDKTLEKNETNTYSVRHVLPNALYIYLKF